MGKVFSITLDDQMDAFVGAQLSEGEYANANELFEAALQLLKTNAEEIEAIRAAIVEGEESGEPREFDPEQFLQEMHSKYVVNESRIQACAKRAQGS